MSRFGDDDCDQEEFPGQYAFWQANFERAMKGRKGRKFLADLKAALLALPEHKLIEGALCTVGADQRSESMDSWSRGRFTDTVQQQGEGVCAIGAYLWHRKVQAGADPNEAFASLPTVYDEDDGDLYTTANLAREAGVVFSVAWDVAYRNDEKLGGRTPEQRHAAFIEWIDGQLAAAAA